MAVQILSQSYGPRKPLIECTADSLDDLVGLVCAEGSTATVGGTEYVLDRVNGWVEPGSGGGGGSDSGVTTVIITIDDETGVGTMNKTWQEISDALTSLRIVFLVNNNGASGVYCGYVTYVTQIIGGAYDVEAILQYYQDDPGTFVSQPVQFSATSPDGYPSHGFSN